MYFNNGGNGCCGAGYPTYPMYYGSCGNYGSNNNYAIILVLFILLVIVIGARNSN